MIIYTTDLQLLSGDLNSFPSRVGTVVLARGGYVAGVETRDENGVPTTTVKVRVPPQQYEATMSELRDLALEIRDEKATTQDVTEEFSDVQTQLASLEATHAQLLELMQRAGSVDELLKVQQQAAQVKLQIDRLKGRSNALQRLSDFATITVKAFSAPVVLQREFVTVRNALRKAETNRASLLEQLQRAKTVDEQNALRDRLGEVALELNRQQTRLAEIQAKAQQASITLPETVVEQIAATEPAPSGFLVPPTIRQAWQASLDVLLAIAGVIVFLWWTIPLGIVAWLVFRSLRTPRRAVGEA